MKQLQRSLLAIGVAATLCSHCNRKFSGRKQPLAVKGVLDLRAATDPTSPSGVAPWDFEKDGPIQLKGEWEFYWKQLLAPISDKTATGISGAGLRPAPEIRSLKNKLTPDYIYAPGKWNDHVVDGKPIGGTGYATYQLQLLLPTTAKNLAMYVGDGQGSAYATFFNAMPAAKNGSVGISTEAEVAKYLPQYAALSDAENPIVLVQISNHVHSNGGQQTPIVIGSSSDIFSRKDRSRLIEGFLAGTIIIMGLYHLGLFFYRRKDKGALWFGLLCLTMTLRLLLTGERLLIEALPHISWAIFLKLEYLSLYSLPPLFVIFMRFLYPKEIANWAVRLTMGYTFPGIFATIVLSPYLFTYTLIFFQIFTLFCMIYGLVALLRAAMHRQPGARLILIGFAVYFSTGINDILYNHALTSSGFLLPFGLFVMIFAQAGALAHRIAIAFNSSEDLAQNLESKVGERTYELDKKSQELANSKTETETLNNLVRSINEELDLKLIMKKVYRYVNGQFGMKYYSLMTSSADNSFLKIVDANFPDYVSEEDRLTILNFEFPINQDIGTHSFVIRGKRPFFVADTANSRMQRGQTEAERFVLNTTKLKSIIVIPLILANNPIGTLDFSNDDKMELLKGDITKLSILAENLAGIIYSKGLLNQVQAEREIALKAKAEIEKRNAEIDGLNRIARQVNETPDLDKILDLVANYVFETFGLRHYLLWRKSPNENKLVAYRGTFAESISPEQRAAIRQLHIPLDGAAGMHTSACRTGRSIYFRGMQKRQSGDAVENEINRLAKFESLLVIPLIVGGQAIGTIDFSHYSGVMTLEKADIRAIAAFCEQIAGVINSAQLLQETHDAKQAAELERSKSDKLLLNILPPQVAEELKRTEQVEPQYFESVSVLFTDFVGFTKISETMTPNALVKELDGCFSQFDQVAKRNNLEKLKTIGDAYMCAAGLPVPSSHHAIDICLAALEFRSFMLQMQTIKDSMNLPYWQLRIGINSGAVTAGVIGTNKFSYDIWGDTVNTASRMESSGEPGRINISGATYDLVKDLFDCEYRGKVKAKGKGDIDMYFLLRIKPELSADADGLLPNAKFLQLSA